MTRTPKIALGVSLAAAIGGGAIAWMSFAPRRTPQGQPPLLTLDGRSLEALKQSFNGAKDKTRIVALLSPT